MNKKVIAMLVVAVLLVLFIAWKIATDHTRAQCGRNDFSESVECK